MAQCENVHHLGLEIEYHVNTQAEFWGLTVHTSVNICLRSGYKILEIVISIVECQNHIAFKDEHKEQVLVFKRIEWPQKALIQLKRSTSELQSLLSQ